MPINSNPAYSTVAEDYQGDCWRPNQISQNIHGRLNALENATGTAATPPATGTTGTAGNSGYVVDAIVAGAITPDLGLAFSHEIILVSNSPITINNPIFTGGIIDPGQDLWIIVVQDATGSRPAPAWGANYSGVGSGTSIGPNSNTYSVFVFKVRADNKFALLYATKGLSR